jgi:hypothetical protein
MYLLHFVQEEHILSLIQRYCSAEGDHSPLTTAVQRRVVRPLVMGHEYRFVEQTPEKLLQPLEVERFQVFVVWRSQDEELRGWKSRRRGEEGSVVLRQKKHLYPFAKD